MEDENTSFWKKTVKPRQALFVFVTLSILFVIYSFSIYWQPKTVQRVLDFDTVKASEGRIIFQKYNCQSCHQFYGLGGHLGPDLTNEYSRLNGNEAALRIYFQGGMKQMPKFDLTTEEEDALIEFLKSTDASGRADPRTFKRLRNGMTQQDERK